MLLLILKTFLLQKETLEVFKKTLPTHMFFNKPFQMFRDQNWLMVMHGLKMLDREKIKSIFDFQNEDILYAANDAIKTYNDWESGQTFIPHRQALEIIMDRSTVHTINFDNEK
jgi:hypothetical protein